MKAESRLSAAPGVNNVGTLDSAILKPVTAEFPARIRVSRQADEYLDRLAEALTLGQVGLHQLEGGLLALALAVDTSNRDELRRLAAYVGHVEYERDRLHWIAYNPGKTGADYYAATTAELWRQGGAS